VQGWGCLGRIRGRMFVGGEAIYIYIYYYFFIIIIIICCLHRRKFKFKEPGAKRRIGRRNVTLIVRIAQCRITG